MPLVGPTSYIIDFAVLENNNPKTIVLLDQSSYLTPAQKPLLQVTLPGFTGSVQVPYAPNTIITLNSDSLSLTEPCDYDYTAELPDGVYEIIMMVCPYNELFNKQCYLKTTQLDVQYRNLLLNLDINCKCLDEKKLKEQIIDADILIQSAKAECSICNIEKSMQKYRTAVKLIESINKKLNCK